MKETNQRHLETLIFMIKVNTVASIDENKTQGIKDIESIIDREFPRIGEKLEKFNVEGNLVFKWAGVEKHKKALGFMAHMDTPSFTDGWVNDPLSGTIEDGYVWGRGAINGKGRLCSILASIEELIKEGYTPQRDIYVISTIDEEIQGRGAKKVLEFFKKRSIVFETILDGGSAIIDSFLPGVKGSIAMVAVAEKGRVNLKFKSNKEDLVARNEDFNNLRAVLEKKDIFEKHITQEAIITFEALAKQSIFPFNVLYSNESAIKGLLPLTAAVKKEFLQMIRTRCKFKNTNKKTEYYRNYREAILQVSVSDGVKNALDVVKKVANDFDLEVDATYISHSTSEFNYRTEGFRTIKDAYKTVFNKEVVVPSITVAHTHSKKLEVISDEILRFSPIVLNNEMLKSIHGKNEKIAIEAYYKSIDFQKEFIKEYR